MSSSKIKVQSVESARAQIVDMLQSLGEDESPGFSKWALDKDSVDLIHISRSDDGKQGKIVVEMLVNERMSNQLGNMHGGCQATVLDNITSMVIYLHTTGVLGDPWSMLGVSQSIQILYTQPAPVGQYIDIECSTISIGRSIAVIQCNMYTKDKKGGKRLRMTSSGTHTKVDNSTSKL